jgi:hypothetical protein
MNGGSRLLLTAFDKHPLSCLGIKRLLKLLLYRLYNLLSKHQLHMVKRSALLLLFLSLACTAFTQDFDSLLLIQKAWRSAGKDSCSF